MVMHNPQADHAAHNQNRWRHDLGNTLTVISARTRLQQRMTLRASGLTDQERTRTLTNLEAVLAAVEGLEVQLEALLRTGHVPQGESPSKAPS
jgi:hypothetical protein